MVKTVTYDIMSGDYMIHALGSVNDVKKTCNGMW